MSLRAAFRSSYRGIASYMVFGGKEPYRIEHLYLTADQYMREFDETIDPASGKSRVWNYTREEWKRDFADHAGGYFRFCREPATAEEIEAVKSAD